MREAIGVAIIENGKILLVRKKQTWILPGGKPEIGETDKECLLREMSQELPKLTLKNLKYFGEFIGTTPHKGDQLCATVYLADAEGDITPSAEINAAEWVENPKDYNLSDITRKIIDELYKQGYL